MRAHGLVRNRNKLSNWAIGALSMPTRGATRRPLVSAERRIAGSPLLRVLVAAGENVRTPREERAEESDFLVIRSRSVHICLRIHTSPHETRSRNSRGSTDKGQRADDKGIAPPPTPTSNLPIPLDLSPPTYSTPRSRSDKGAPEESSGAPLSALQSADARLTSSQSAPRRPEGFCLRGTRATRRRPSRHGSSRPPCRSS